MSEELKARTVEKADWYWCGYPGHFICASMCHFHLHTRVGHVIVSTVGDYHMTHDGPRESIGRDRDFETYVFLVKDTERPEGEPLDYNEMDARGSNDSEESERQHHAMCKKWSTAKMQAKAIAAWNTIKDQNNG